MSTITVIYTGILVIEKEKIYLKDISVKSDFATTPGDFLDCATDYNTFSLREGSEITFLEKPEKITGVLHWDKEMEKWFIFDKKRNLYDDIKEGMLVTHNCDIFIVDPIEWETVTRNKNKIIELIRLLKVN